MIWNWHQITCKSIIATTSDLHFDNITQYKEEITIFDHILSIYITG